MESDGWVLLIGLASFFVALGAFMLWRGVSRPAMIGWIHGLVAVYYGLMLACYHAVEHWWPLKSDSLWIYTVPALLIALFVGLRLPRRPAEGPRRPFDGILFKA